MAQENARIDLEVTGSGNVARELDNVKRLVNNVASEIGEKINPFASPEDFRMFSTQVNQMKQSLIQGRSEIEQRITSSLSKDDLQKFRGGDLSVVQGKERKQLEDVNKQLELFEGNVKQVNDIFRDVSRGKRGLEGLEGGGVRNLGLLERLQLQEGALRRQLKESTTPEDIKTVRSQLETVQRRIDQAQGGTSLSTQERQIVATTQTAIRQGVVSAASGLGSTIGQITSGAINIGRAVQEAASIDPVKAAAGTVAAAGITSAVATGLTLPRAQGLIQSRLALRNLTGTSQGINASDLGLTEQEFNQYAFGLSRNLESGQGINQRARSLLALEQGTGGVGVGGLQQITGQFRYSTDADRGKSIDENIGKMLKIFDESGFINISKGQFARLGAGSERVAGLLRQQQQLIGEGNINQAATLVTQLQTGTLRGSAGINVLNRFGQSIQNPGNEFLRARVFRAIAQENPNIDIDELRSRIETGIADPRNLNAVLNFERRAAGGDERTLIRNLTSYGLTFNQARDLLADANATRRGGEFAFGETDVTNEQGAATARAVAFRGTVQGGGVARTTAKIKEIDQQLAELGVAYDDVINNFLEGVLSSTKKGFEAVKEIEAAKPIVDDIVGEQKEDLTLLNQANQRIIEDLTKGVGIVTDKTADMFEGVVDRFDNVMDKYFGQTGENTIKGKND